MSVLAPASDAKDQFQDEMEALKRVERTKSAKSEQVRFKVPGSVGKTGGDAKVFTDSDIGKLIPRIPDITVQINNGALQSVKVGKDPVRIQSVVSVYDTIDFASTGVGGKLSMILVDHRLLNNILKANDERALKILVRHEYVEKILNKDHAMASAVDSHLENTTMHALMKYVVPLMSDKQLMAIGPGHLNDKKYINAFYRAVIDELRSRAEKLAGSNHYSEAIDIYVGILQRLLQAPLINKMLIKDVHGLVLKMKVSPAIQKKELIHIYTILSKHLTADCLFAAEKHVSLLKSEIDAAVKNIPAMADTAPPAIDVFAMLRQSFKEAGVADKDVESMISSMRANIAERETIESYRLLVESLRKVYMSSEKIAPLVVSLINKATPKEKLEANVSLVNALREAHIDEVSIVYDFIPRFFQSSMSVASINAFVDIIVLMKDAKIDRRKTEAVLQYLNKSQVPEDKWHIFVKLAAPLMRLSFRSPDKIYKTVERFLSNSSSNYQYASQQRIDTMAHKIVLFSQENIPLEPRLIDSEKSGEELIARMNEIKQRIEGDEVGKPFNINDDNDVYLNYILLLKESPKATRLSYGEFRAFIDSQKNKKNVIGTDISSEKMIQLRALVYEAYKILELVDTVRKKSQRPVVIVANKSYGPYAISPIRNILNNMGVKIIETKMGSTTCHESPCRISWDSDSKSVPLFVEDIEGAITTFAEERPHVIVVDASYSLDAESLQQFTRKEARFPDAYQGYRNWFIGLNEGIRKGPADLVGDFQVPNDFLKRLNREEFSRFVEAVKSKGIQVDNNELYHMRFWTPASVPLYFCEMRAYRDEDPKIVDTDDDLRRPTVIFVESAIESHAHYPAGIGAWVNTGTLHDARKVKGDNRAAYFDDKDHFNEFRFSYEPGAGVMTTSIYERTGKQLLEEELLPMVGEQKEYAQYLSRRLVHQEIKTFDGCVFDLTGTLANYTEEIPDYIAKRMNDLLRRGVKVAIVSDDAARDSIEKRLIDKIDVLLRRNLNVYLHGGNVLWQYDDKGGKNVVFDNRVDMATRNLVENAVRDSLRLLRIARFSFDPDDHQVSIDLTEYIKSAHIDDRDRLRRDIIREIEKILSSVAGISFHIYLLGRHHISVRTSHKVEAVKDFMQRNGLRETGLLIAGNEAGSRQNDREMLKAFPSAIKVNVGTMSRSMTAKAAGKIYQIGVSSNHNMVDIIRMFGCVTDNRINLTRLDKYDLSVEPERHEHETEALAALKIPGTLGFEVDERVDMNYLDSLLKRSQPARLSAERQLQLVDIIRAKTGKTISANSFRIRILDDIPSVGIPKFKDAAKTDDQMTAISSNENGTLVVYVTQAFYDRYCTKRDTLMAEIIDHEYSEKIEGKTHRDIAPRARFFAQRGGLSPYHEFVLSELAGTDTGLMVLSRIVDEFTSGKRVWTDENDKAYEELFAWTAAEIVRDNNKRMDYIAEEIRHRYAGPKISVIGAVSPTAPYTIDIGVKIGAKLREYAGTDGYIFTGGVEGVGLDIYGGIASVVGGGEDRFFVLLPEGVNVPGGYNRVSQKGAVAVEYFGSDMFERRIGMGKVADVVIVLNGGGGTLHEAACALADGKKVIVFDYGGAGSALYQAKKTGAVSAELERVGITERNLDQIILGSVDAIDADIEAALGSLAVPPARTETKNLEGTVSGEQIVGGSL